MLFEKETAKDKSALYSRISSRYTDQYQLKTKRRCASMAMFNLNHPKTAPRGGFFLSCSQKARTIAKEQSGTLSFE